MLSKLGCYIKDFFADIKRKLFFDKVHLFIILGSAALGILAALAKDYSEFDDTNNFVFVVINVSTSPIPQFLRILFWLCGIYAAAFLACAHIYLFYVAIYVGPGIVSYFVFRRAFIACAVNSLTGIIYLVLFVIPVFAVTLFAFVCLSLEFRPIVMSSGSGKSALPLKCNAHALWEKLKTVFIVNYLIVTAYWLVFYLILLLFAK